MPFIYQLKRTSKGTVERILIDTHNIQNDTNIQNESEDTQQPHPPCRIWIPNKYQKIKCDKKDGDKTQYYCAICHENMKEGEYYRELNCGHSFHKKCIDKWLVIDADCACPLCRQVQDSLIV
tara:strand:+ start:410 stop:775 length:366 start_codon:yes stop_codon:yes gene_type:complete